MDIKIFNANEEYTAVATGLIDAIHRESINGEDLLTLISFDDDIRKGYRIVYQQEGGIWKEFIVKEVKETRLGDAIQKDVYCEASIYETIGDYIHDRRPYETTAVAALGVALEPSRWKIGAVGDFGSASTNFYHTNTKAAIGQILETWECEIRTRITIAENRINERYVDLLERRGESKGLRLTYKTGMTQIARTIHREDVITAMYGYGKGEFIDETGGWGRRISFEEINDGKGYVENDEARQVWGRLDGDGERVHVFGVAEFDDCEEVEELKALTEKALEVASQPVIHYEVMANEVGDLELGDTVTVIDTDFEPELRILARVIEIERNLLNPAETRVVLGRFIPTILDTVSETEKFVGNWRSKYNIWDRASAFDEDGKLPATEISDLTVISQAMIDLSRTYAGAMGYHTTVLTDEVTGAQTLYMHDELDIENSTYISCVPEPGTFLWTDGGWNEGEPNWNSGFDKDGNALLRKIVVEGIAVGRQDTPYSTHIEPNQFDIRYGDMPVISMVEDEVRAPKIISSEYFGIGRIKFIPAYDGEEMIGTDIVFMDDPSEI